VLEIGRGNRTQPFNLRFHREEPLIPRELRFEIEERMEASGRVRMPLRIGPARGARWRAEGGAESNPWPSASSIPTSIRSMSRRRPTALRALLPDVFITTGSELSREWHEFERTATAAANAMSGRR